MTEINYPELIDSWVDQHKKTVDSLNSIKQQVEMQGEALKFSYHDEDGKSALIVIPAHTNPGEIQIHLFDPKVKHWDSSKKGKTYSFWPDKANNLQGYYRQWDYDNLENTQSLDHYYQGFYAKFSPEYKNLVDILSNAQHVLLNNEVKQNYDFLTQAIPQGNTIILTGVTIGHYLEPKTGSELVISVYDKNINPWTYRFTNGFAQDPNQLRILDCVLTTARNQLAKEAQG